MALRRADYVKKKQSCKVRLKDAFIVWKQAANHVVTVLNVLEIRNPPISCPSLIMFLPLLRKKCLIIHL